jgi:hypothetical protein
MLSGSLWFEDRYFLDDEVLRGLPDYPTYSW